MRPTREKVLPVIATYFFSTQTAARTPFFRHDRWARKMMETIMHYGQSGYKLHAFVIMPDHLHLLITPAETLEKAVQLLKGGFSFRAHKEFDWQGEIWQSGFTDHRIRDEEDWNRHLQYIRSNPLDAHLARDSSPYAFMEFPDPQFPQGLKLPYLSRGVDVRAEARTLHSNFRAASAAPFQSSRE